MTKFEYKHVELNPGMLRKQSAYDSIDEKLTQLGKEGWVLDQFQTDPQGYFHYVFRRPLPSDF